MKIINTFIGLYFRDSYGEIQTNINRGVPIYVKIHVLEDGTFMKESYVNERTTLEPISRATAENYFSNMKSTS